MKIKIVAASAMALSLAACATLEEGVAEALSETYYATLTGANVPGGGDRDGYGQAEISVSDEAGQVCHDLNDLRGLGTITGAHIHRGAPGTTGPVVFTLRAANEGGYKGCTDASEFLQEFLEGSPGAFYVQVHTNEYPNGAIRGQLSNRDG